MKISIQKATVKNAKTKKVTKSKSQKTHSLMVYTPYFKEGDDLYRHLQKANYDLYSALKAWAKDLQTSAKKLKSLSRIVKGKCITSWGDTHLVLLLGVTQTDKKLIVKNKLGSLA